MFYKHEQVKKKDKLFAKIISYPFEKKIFGYPVPVFK